MPGKNKNKKIRFPDFLRYKAGKMTGKEMNSFERELMRDPFAEEAAEGFDLIAQKEALSDINTLKKRLEARTAGKKRFIFYRIAASIAVLMIISTLFVIIDKNKTSKRTAENTGKIKELVIARNQPIEEPLSKDKKGEEKSPAEAGRSVKPVAPAMNMEIAEQKRSVEKLEISEVGSSQNLPELRKNQYNISLAQEPEAILAKKPVRVRHAQEYIVYGRVISTEDSLPVPGVSVVIKGTTTGVISDQEGNFKINLPDSTPRTMLATYIGMEGQEFEARADTQLQVSLRPSVSALSEVVVTAYGISRKDAENDETKVNYTSPQPMGGKSEFDKYVQNNQRRIDSTSTGQRVVVVLSFRVLANGSIDSIMVVRSPGKSFSDEAKRLLKEGPKWNPAVDNGKNVDDNVRLRIVFK